MKNMRKLASLLLALVMVFAMATTAFAATITIIPPTVPEGATETGITYTAYKVFDATITEDEDGNITAAAYTIKSNSPYYTAVSTSTYFTLTLVAGTTDTYTVVANDDYTVEAANTFADTLKAVEGASPVGTFTKQDDGSYKSSELADGYYLVTSSVGSDLLLYTLGDVKVNTKNEYPTLTKEADKETADKGEDVTFTVKVTIPEDAVGEIVVHDTMTNLTYQSWTEVAGISVKTSETCGCTFEFTLSADYVNTNKGTTVEIVYVATMAADAIANNEAYLVDSTYTSKPVEEEVLTTDVIITKIDSADKNKTLAGAKFVLYKEVKADDEETDTKYYYKVTDGNVSWVTDQTQATEVTTGEDGKASFDNIANGKYYLLETEAPAGYNQLDKAVEVNVTAKKVTENETATVEAVPVSVENSSGSTLPSTGGMGTTLFYIVGGILVVAAVVLLVTKKRMAVAE